MILRYISVAALMALTTGMVCAAPPVLDPPSGAAVALMDHFTDQQGMGETWRFRFVAPAIGGAAPLGYDEVEADMTYLCESVAVPEILQANAEPWRIVITLRAEPVAFGEPAPDVRQYFEAYSLRDGRCIWEAF
mgnify:FL=1